MIKKFKKSELTQYGLPLDEGDGARVLERELVGSSRWSLEYNIVFQLPDMPEKQAWLAGYSIGATECQDERPWEYDDEIKCTLVELRPVTTEQWVAVGGLWR